jgi:hypothetical protein
MKRTHVSVFAKWCFFMEYHSLSVDSWPYIKTAHIPFKSGLLEFASVSQIVWEGHMLLTCAIFIVTALILWWGLEILMPTMNSLLPSLASVYYRHMWSWAFVWISECKICCSHIPVQEIFYFHQLWVHVFGINNQKMSLFIYIRKQELREDQMKYVPYYWITSRTVNLKLSRNCLFFLTFVLAKT